MIALMVMMFDEQIDLIRQLPHNTLFPQGFGQRISTAEELPQFTIHYQVDRNRRLINYLAAAFPANGEIVRDGNAAHANAIRREKADARFGEPIGNER